jgi:hypothetical protein
MRVAMILSAILLGAALGAVTAYFAVREILWAQHVAQYGEMGEFWGDFFGLFFAAPAGAILGGGVGAFLQIRISRRRRNANSAELDREV